MSGIAQGFRTSPQQRRLWDLKQACSEQPLNAVALLQMQGLYDPEQLRAALITLTERYEVLRTEFVTVPGLNYPLQKAGETADFSWRTVDLTHLEPSVQSVRVDELYEAECQECGEAQHGPALSATLIQLAPDECLLLLRLPSLCADWQTLDLIAAELGGISLINSAEEPLQYIDLAEWQNELLEVQETESGRQYWTGKQPAPEVSGLLPYTQGANDHRPVAHHRYGRLLGREQVERMNGVAAQYGVTVDSFLLATWQHLLQRVTGHTRLTLGVMYDGRKYDDLHAALGPFERYLPIVAEAEESLPFHAHLSSTHEAMQEAGRYQEFYSWTEVPGRPAPPFYGFGFEYRQPSGFVASGGCGTRIIRRRLQGEWFQARLICQPCDDGLLAELEVSSDVAAEKAALLEEQFHVLLNAGVANPATELSALPVLPDHERQRLVTALNGSSAVVTSQGQVHQLFEEWAGKTPEAPAVVCEDVAYSYAELNARAGALAQRLRAIGVAADALVAICADRSLDWIVAMLAVLKAGGAYLPLDPELPRERLALMLSDALPVAVLTQSQLRDKLPESSARTLLLDGAGVSPAEVAGALASDSASSSLAYVLYTSGSTGAPKGVAVEGRHLMSYVQAIVAELQPAPGDSYACVSTLAADLGNTMIYPALCTGGVLHVITQDRSSSGPALAEYCQQHRIDWLKIVPSHLGALMSVSEPELLLPRKGLVLGGAASDWALMQRVQSLAPQLAIFNHYGPTETTVGATTYRVNAPHPHAATVPIGRPLANTRVYLLDRHMQPTPEGVEGELFIGGAGVSRGYLNRPELTAERYMSDPFESGGRLYRTGDRARLLPDGHVEFLGRFDDQVKVRGFRIELGEIEANLHQHSGVYQAVVLHQVDARGESGLFAYVVPNTGVSEPAAADLRTFLAERLPAYMIPAGFAVLDRLPLTPNGKVDRKALAAIATSGTARTRVWLPPQTPLEELLAQAWAQVLGVDQVGLDDNFFDVGGHSLLATLLVSRIRNTFGVTLPLRTVFQAPTLQGMAAEVERLRLEAHYEDNLPLERVEHDGAMPLSHAQERLWFLHQLDPGNPAYNMRFMAGLEGALNLPALEQSLQELVSRHEVLRTTYEKVNGRPVQVVRPLQAVNLPTTDLGALSGAEQELEVQRLIAEQTRLPFDLENGPVFRLLLMRLGPQEHRLLLTLHHIVADAWTIGVIAREVALLYNAFSKGLSSPLPELTIQYADFAVWQRNWLEGENLKRHLDYWKNHLAGSPALLSLPTDYPRPPIQTYLGAFRRHDLPLALTGALKRLCRQEGVTLFMALLGGLQLLLSRLSGQKDVLVGSPIANRTRSEIEHLVGVFLNTLVFRTNMKGNPTFRELLAQVRETVLTAYDHQEVPFELVVQAGAPARSVSWSPLFQVMLNFQNTPQTRAPFEDLQVSFTEVDNGTAKFDLLINFIETEDGLVGGWEYNRALFDEATVDRFAATFQLLLENLTSNPDTQVEHCRLLADTERHQLLVEWNDTAASEEGPATLVQHLIEEQAARCPDAVAVVCRGRQMTYRELNARAESLAAYLRQQGAGPETLVGVCTTRSPELVVAMLGVFKAGAACVPMDPIDPPARLGVLAREARVQLLLSEPEVAGRLNEIDAPIVLLKPDWPCAQESPGAQSGSLTSPENLAYVIFTSSATGPAGVAITHAALANYVAWSTRTYGADAGSAAPIQSSIAFEHTVVSLFVPLAAGGTVVLLSETDGLDGMTAPVEGRPRFGFLKVTAAQLALLASTLRPEQVSGLTRTMVIAGGSLSYDALRFWQEHAPDTRLITEYGFAETVAGCCAYLVPQGESGELEVPVGRPIAHNQLYVLDPNMEPVPVGVVGELYVGGAGIARGYLGRPDLTAERFVQHPFSSEPGAHLYRTGALARYRSDGVVVSCGRTDGQVNIRGVHVEPAEVESVLLGHPSVRAATVIPRKDGADADQLAAFVVPVAGSQLDPQEVRRFLAGLVPAYMVPASVVLLDALPLLPDGRADRKQLSVMTEVRRQGASEYVAPRTELERLVAGVWQDVLHLEQVGTSENFFDVGGHSLRLIEVHTRLEAALGRQFPLVKLFEHVTVSAQAQYLSGGEQVTSVAAGRDRAALRRELARRRGSSRS